MSPMDTSIKAYLIIQQAKWINKINLYSAKISVDNRMNASPIKDLH